MIMGLRDRVCAQAPVINQSHGHNGPNLIKSTVKRSDMRAFGKHREFQSSATSATDIWKPPSFNRECSSESTVASSDYVLLDDDLCSCCCVQSRMSHRNFVAGSQTNNSKSTHCSGDIAQHGNDVWSRESRLDFRNGWTTNLFAPLGCTFFLLFHLLLTGAPVSASASGTSLPSVRSNNNESVNPCWYMDSKKTRLVCNGTASFTFKSNDIGMYQRIVHLNEIHLEQQYLNLSRYTVFPNLAHLTITHSSIRELFGPLPLGVRTLNLSHNALESVDESVFHVIRNKSTKSSTAPPVSELEDVDFTYNNFSSIPKGLLNISRIKAIRFKGNPLECKHVWYDLWNWTSELTFDPLVDANVTRCEREDTVFNYTVKDILEARTNMENICETVNKSVCHSCELYTLHRAGQKNETETKLRLDCSGHNLTELPDIPQQTWELNISNNDITNLTALKDAMYSNLIFLYADNNRIQLETLAGTPFLDKFRILALRNNQITSFPTSVLIAIKNGQNQGLITLGENYIECDCDTANEVKTLLIQLSITRKVLDMNDIHCRHPANLKVKDLASDDVCRKDEPANTDFWVYILIAMEVVLISFVVLKVWYDQRIFRQTGVLPWFSAKMPRLPCDAMLESIKDPPHYHQGQGSETYPLQQSSSSNQSSKSGKSSRSSSSQGSSV